MNIIEAIKSGKPFRRKGRPWFVGMRDFFFMTEDVLADDWEIFQPSVRITAAEFGQAFNQALRQDVPTLSFELADMLHLGVARRLGLMGPE